MPTWYKRRLRIEYKQPEQSAPDSKPVGYRVTVHDADTGEQITNIRDIVVYLRAGGINEAAVTYYEQNSDGTLNNKHDAVKTTTLSSIAELDVLAMEERSWLTTIVFQALGEASMCWSERPRSVFQSQEAQRIGNALIHEILRVIHHERTNATAANRPAATEKAAPSARRTDSLDGGRSGESLDRDQPG